MKGFGYMKFSRYLINRFFRGISIFCFCLMFIFSAQPHALVFVHLGPSLPEYLEDAVFQASLFNSPNEICVIVNEQALEKPNNLGKFATVFVAENLEITERHSAFRKNSTLYNSFSDPFWFYTYERFLYLDDFMQQYDVKDLFHIENDVVIFVDLKELLPIFQHEYRNGIAAVFDNDDRCVPGFIYVSDKNAMADLAAFMVEHVGLGKIDMDVLGLYKKQHPTKIKNLPIIPSSYSASYPLESISGDKTQNAAAYSKNIDKFQSVFDAAAIGQYLGGTDPRNGPSSPGFINERCLFNPANFNYEVQSGGFGRLIPYLLFLGKKYRINNLHIHSKNLEPFLSKKIVDFKYKFTNDPIDVVIPCIKKDQRTLDLAISGIKENGYNIRNVYLVAPECLSTNAIWIDEKSFPFTQKDIAVQIFDNDEAKASGYMSSKDSRTGWIYQQLLKFYAPFVIPGISQNVLILDADTVFLKPVKFQAQSGAALFNPSPEYYPPYFEHAYRVIPGFRKVFAHYSGVSHHMLFQRCVLEDLFQIIKKTHKAEPWIALIKNIDKKDLFGSGLSEYEIYFNFVFSHDNQVQIRPLKWVESGNLKKLQEYKDAGYDYVSFHSNYPISSEFRHIGAEDL